MSPLLFALVDAVLANEATLCRFVRAEWMRPRRAARDGFRRMNYRRAGREVGASRQDLGWWRSLWGVL